MNILMKILFLLALICGYFLFGFKSVAYSYLLFSIIIRISVIVMEIISSKTNTAFRLAIVGGIFFAILFSLTLTQLLEIQEQPQRGLIVFFSLLSFFYISSIAIYRIAKGKFLSPYKTVPSDVILLDTSAIIDGRIADLFATKFLDTRVIIPKFVLKELQNIADSRDPLKRARGRRGLDILNRMRKTKIDIVIDETDFSEINDVDTKLLQLAKVLNAKVMTNDYNLNKVAQLQGVLVLNINDLANALKPVVLPGERMRIKVIKEGKEHNQGVGYLQDGTMVVVEEGRNLIGRTIDVVVTSVLQTSAGRMIFTKSL
jgi:uncharacterized protein YacL